MKLIPVPGVENAAYHPTPTARLIYVNGQVVPLVTLTENHGTYAMGFSREVFTDELIIVCDAISALVAAEGLAIADKVRRKGARS